MADFDKCVPALSKALGKSLSKEEVESIIAQVKDRTLRKQRDNEFLSLADAVRAAAKEIKDEKLMNAARVERDAYLRAIAWKSATAEIERMKADFDKLGKGWDGWYDALRTYYFGRVGPVEGSGQGLFERAHNLSIASVERMVESRNRIMREHGLTTRVGSDGWRFFGDPAVDRRVSIAVGHMSNGVKPEDVRVDGKALSKLELAIARNELNHLNEVRAYANDRGASIGHADGYMGRMAHDPDAILKAGMANWVAKASSWLNPELVEDLGQKGLEQAWRNLVEGRHLGVSQMDMAAFYKDYTPGTKIRPEIQNLISKLSAEKTLLFKDPESAYAYRQEFGGGRSIFEIVANQVRRTIHDAEIIHAQGPTPEAMAKELISFVQNRASADGQQKTVNRIGQSYLINGIESSLRGDRYLTINSKVANADSAIRNTLTAMRLGWGVIRQIPDFFMHASTMRWHGQSYFGSLMRGVGDFLNVFPSATRDEIAYRLGGVGALNGIDVARMGLTMDDMAGVTGKIAEVAMTLSGQSRETRVLFRRGVIDANTALAYWGAEKNVKFNDLDLKLRTKLLKAGINEPLYDFLRQHLAVDVEGFKIIDPTRITDMMDANDPNLRAFVGPDLNERQFRIAAQDISNTIRSYGINAAREALSEPTEAINLLKSLQNSKRGSVPGTIASQLTQFKAYSVTQIVRHLGRELYDTGRIDWTGMAGYGFGALTGGYAVLALQSILTGKTPPDPTKPKTILDAVVMGGLAGFATDTLQNIDRSNYDVVARMLTPPVGGLAADLYAMVIRHPLRALTVDNAKGTFGKDMAKEIFSVQPQFNLWWTRMVTDMFLRYRAMEAVDPGFYARQERDLARAGQRHYVQPVLTPLW